MNNNFNRYAMLSSLILLTSCASMRVGGDADNPNSTTVVTATEWNDFAHKMVTAIHQSGVLRRSGAAKAKSGSAEPIVLAMADWHTKQENMAQRDLTRSRLVMYSAIRSKLISTGSVVVTMALAGDKADSSSTDSLVMKVRELRRSQEYNPNSVAEFQLLEGADLGMSGMVVPITVSDGRTTRTDYSVTIRVLDLRKGYTVFEQQFNLPKSFKKGFFGRP